MNITVRGRGSQARPCENGNGQRGRGRETGQKDTKWHEMGPTGRHQMVGGAMGQRSTTTTLNQRRLSRNGNNGEQSRKMSEEKWVVCGWAQNDECELAEYLAFCSLVPSVGQC